MDITFQREDIGEYGFAAKVVPEYSEKSQKTFKGCLHKVGSKHFPIKAQSIVPDPIYFKVSCACFTNKFVIFTDSQLFAL